MNFTVADMLAGGISIAQTFFHWGDTMIANFRNLPWIHTGVPFLLLFAIFLFPLMSLTNIALISLQQAHAKCSEDFCSLYLGVIKAISLICLLII